MLCRLFQDTVRKANAAIQEVYGGRLVSVVIFGSVGRNTPNQFSDIDMIIVAEPLPKGRIKRMEEFLQVENKIEQWLEHLRKDKGIDTYLSPVIKTPAEVEAGSPLFLDLTDDAVIIYDRNSYFKDYLSWLNLRLQKMGAKKIYNGERWHWLIKPDYRKGDIFEI